MSTVLAPALYGGLHSLRRFSVAEYHRMIQAGVLTDEDQVELLEGYVVLKMPKNPPHCGTIQLLQEVITAILPRGWRLRIQSAITLGDSEPEPDGVLVRGDARTYLSRHPVPADVGLIIEVAQSSLDRDRTEKARIYAQAGIPIYWIVNLVDRQIEVRTVPGVVASQPAYTQQQDYSNGAAVEVVLDGTSIATIAVVELLP